MLFDLSNIYNLDKAQLYLHKLSKDKCKVEIKKVREKRSINQNNYFHGVVCSLFGLELGYTIEESKQIFRELFLSYEKKDKTFYKSTTELNTKEFEDFASKCRMFASQQGIYIPLPNEVTDDLINEIEKNKLYL